MEDDNATAAVTELVISEWPAVLPTALVDELRAELDAERARRVELEAELATLRRAVKAPRTRTTTTPRAKAKASPAKATPAKAKPATVTPAVAKRTRAKATKPKKPAAT